MYNETDSQPLTNGVGRSYQAGKSNSSGYKHNGITGGNAILTGKGAMPQKFYPSVGSSMFARARRSYARDAGGGKSWHSSSQHIQLKRINAIGKSSHSNTNKDIAYSSRNVNDARRAARRARSGGAVAPKKKGYYVSPSCAGNDTHVADTIPTQEPSISFVKAKMQNIPLDEIANDILNTTVVEYNKVELTNDDFTNGTYRITTPGEYVLQEDIVFAPNPDNEGKPTQEQLDNLPIGFKLGFFAAITIETDNVVLDLNNHSISQSTLHSVQQTFYSHIELANTPFIMRQGPAAFPENGSAASKTIIKNGTLGLSSHHGIHGNLCREIIIRDLYIGNFGVAAIAINGGINIYLDNVVADNKDVDIMYNSLLSHAIFMKPFLSNIIECMPDASLQILGEECTAQELLGKLEKDIEDANNHIDDRENYTGIFKNAGTLYDGNIYGIVFSSAGVVVGGFKPMRDDSSLGNTDIVVNNVTIKNIESQGEEIKVLTNNVIANEPLSYGSGVVKGPAGDVFDWEKCCDEDGYYKRNCVADAQLCIGKHKDCLDTGTTNICGCLVTWAGEKTTTLSELLESDDLYVVRGRDSMAHIMKGNIGLFISQGDNMLIDNIIIDNVNNTAECAEGASDSSCDITDMDLASSSGILYTGSKNIVCQNYSISNIKSLNGLANDVTRKTDNENIVM